MGTRNLRRRESALHLEVEALQRAMKSMLQHLSCQHFGTDCKDLISMIKEPQAWPNFAIELEAINTLHICFPDFKISHISRARNEIFDYVANSRSFFIVSFVPLVVLFWSDYSNHLKFE